MTEEKKKVDMKLKPTIYLEKDFTFDSSHSLPCVPKGHSCGNLHGHTWQLTVGVTGKIDEERGWIIDFKDIKNLVKEKIIDRFDHAHLNDIVENPTSENLVWYVWKELESEIDRVTNGSAKLAKVTIWETPTSKCTLQFP